MENPENAIENYASLMVNASEYKRWGFYQKYVIIEAH
jgi:hypothetical protein